MSVTTLAAMFVDMTETLEALEEAGGDTHGIELRMGDVVKAALKIADRAAWESALLDAMGK